MIVDIDFSTNTFEFDLDYASEMDLESFDNVQVVRLKPSEMPNYEGNYEVTPKMESQILETKAKYMKDDVTVHAVPVRKTRNSSGGFTVYIATEEVMADG